ncbi:MAG: hypothetical protein ACE5JZ_13355, partial [Kiloniellales bacterium]
MEIDWGVVTTIAAPLVALFVGALVNRALESRPRLVTYLGHVSVHTLKQHDGSTSDVYTHSVVLRNAGRRPATNVRLAHPYLPDFNVLPDVEHRVEDLPGGGKEIVIPTLVPNEQVTISYLYFPPVTWNQINDQIKSDEGLAKVLQVLPTQQYPRWFNRLAAGFMLAG